LGISEIYPEVRAYLPRSNNSGLLNRLGIGQFVRLGDYSSLAKGANHLQDWESIGMNGKKGLDECYVTGFMLNPEGERIRLFVTRGGGSRSFLLPPETGVLDSEYGERNIEHQAAMEKALVNRSKEDPKVLQTLRELKDKIGDGSLAIKASLEILTTGLVAALGNVEGGQAVGEFKKVLGVDKKLLIPDEARRSFQKLGDNVGFKEKSNAVPGVIYTHIGPDGLNVFTVVQVESSRAGYIPVKFLDVTETEEGGFKIQELDQDGPDKLRIDGPVDPDTCLIPSGLIDVVWYDSRRELETYLKIAKVKVDDLVQKGAYYLVSEMIRFRERGY
jgi:hypothetical protein